MAQVRPETTELKEQYAAQVTADLERNTQEQERIGAEVAALQEQLMALQQDQALLEGMRQALATGTGRAPAAAPRKATAEPARRAKKAAAGAPAKPRKTAAKRAGTQQPTLGELIHSHLAAHAEPRSTAEITDALAAANPQRGIKNKVVRTTIEGLVARGRVERRKQGSSVYYTTTGRADTAGSTAQDKSAG
ncbi:MAG TPA: hypothetical protein VLH10_22550 [Yinghuangia sp.]|uniref:hypothetical protein n=1 Tax=Yinghuangia sp. YIM S10712 TaxID=3436930 RepID=UPI002B992ACC|nr:hypothetical protein [Yinghuangia sp.]